MISTIFPYALCIILVVIYTWNSCLLGIEVIKNKELQQENTSLIERNLMLGKQVHKLEKRLKEATELLTIQDKLIKK